MIFDQIDNNVKVRSSCDWYEFEEKSEKVFLNVERKGGCQVTLKNEKKWKTY